MDLEIHRATLDSLTASRKRHFQELRHAPELYLELMVPRASAYALACAGTHSGHLLVAPDGSLIELSLGVALAPRKERHFEAICEALAIRQVRAYSFDSTLVSLCLERKASATLEGLLFREFTRGALAPLPKLRLAVESDIAKLVPIRHGVFDDEEQVAEWVRAGFVFVLDGDGELVGAGLRSPVWPDRPERDIGVLVHPDHRGKGNGSRILARLAEDCVRDGLVPTAGCAIDNLASRAALGRAGFLWRHSLILFEVKASRSS